MACLVIGVRPLIRQGLWPCHLPRGGRLPPAGVPPAGAFPYLPLGEGAAAAAEEGRYQVGHCAAPHPSGLRPATLSQERVVGSPHPALRGYPLQAGEGGGSAGQLT